MATDQRRRSEQNPGLRWQAKTGRSDHTDHVLRQNGAQRQDQQQRQGPPPGNQIRQAGIQADGRKKHDQKVISCLQRKGHFDLERGKRDPGDHCGQQPTGDRLGDVEPAQHRHDPVQLIADQEHRKAQRHGHEIVDLHSLDQWFGHLRPKACHAARDREAHRSGQVSPITVPS